MGTSNVRHFCCKEYQQHNIGANGSDVILKLIFPLLILNISCFIDPFDVKNPPFLYENSYFFGMLDLTLSIIFFYVIHINNIILGQMVQI